MGLELEICDWEWYEPEFGGNRELPEPAAVEVRRPTLAWCYRELERIAAANPKLSMTECSLKLMNDHERLFVGNVRAVRGISVRGQAIETGDALWWLREELNPKFGPLFAEILKAVIDRLMIDEDVKKKSPLPYVSVASIHEISGTAMPAELLGST